MEEPLDRNKPIAAVMVHVADVDAAYKWYAAAFSPATSVEVDDPQLRMLQLGDILIEIVPADEKVRSGAAGTVVYWSCLDFSRTLKHLLHFGATLFRGPMRIEGGMSMCQVQDPWGNCIGIRGPAL